MGSSASSYLFTLATLAVTFVGFSALVIILRQTIGGTMSELDILLTRIFIQLGFTVAAGAMLPALFSLFPLPERVAWRISSLFVAIPILVFALSYPARRRAASGSRTPKQVWFDVMVLLVAGAALLVNAMASEIALAPAVFAASLTAILYLGGLAYLQALSTQLRHSATRSPDEGRRMPTSRSGR